MVARGARAQKLHGQRQPQGGRQHVILEKGQERAGSRRQQKRMKRDKAQRTETLVQRGQARPSSGNWRQSRRGRQASSAWQSPKTGPGKELPDRQRDRGIEEHPEKGESTETPGPERSRADPAREGHWGAAKSSGPDKDQRAGGLKLARREHAGSRGSRRYTREPGQERYQRARTSQEHDSRPSGGELNGNAHRKRLQAGKYEEGVVAIAHHGGEPQAMAERGTGFRRRSRGVQIKWTRKRFGALCAKTAGQHLQR